MSKINRLPVKLRFRLLVYLIAVGYALWRAAWMTAVVIFANDILLGHGSLANLVGGQIALPGVQNIYLGILAIVVSTAHLSTSVVALSEVFHRTDPVFWAKIKKDKA